MAKKWTVTISNGDIDLWISFTHGDEPPLHISEPNKSGVDLTQTPMDRFIQKIKARESDFEPGAIFSLDTIDYPLDSLIEIVKKRLKHRNQHEHDQRKK
jgi:hypothetical protein